MRTALLFLLLPAVALSARTFRGEYSCTGGLDLSVSALREIIFIDDYHVELVLSAVRKPLYFPTIYNIVGDRLYIRHDRNAVFVFKIDGEALVGISHPYEDRRCAKQ